MTTAITGEQVAAAVRFEACEALARALKKITHCVNQLSDEQVWRRASESQNSIGNLILHLCGNLRQWMVAGIGGAPDVRDRPGEFAARGAIGKAELLGRLEAAVAGASAALARLTAEEALRVRRIQGFEESGIGAIFSTIPHFQGHTQEIVQMTRSMLGEKYRFSWKPQTREQGRQREAEARVGECGRPDGVTAR